MKKAITIFSVFILFHFALVANEEYPNQRFIGQLNSNLQYLTENPDTGLFLFLDDIKSDHFANQIDLFPDYSQNIKSNKNFTHRLDSIIEYGNQDFGNPIEKTYYEYHQIGDSMRITSLNLRWSSGSQFWDGRYTERWYNANGNLVEDISITSLDVVNNVWLAGRKIDRSYDANNLLIEQIFYDYWDSSLESWLASRRFVWDLNESGNVTNRLWYSWNIEMDDWVYFQNTKVEWVDVNGMILMSSVLLENWEPEFNEFRNFQIDLYSYSEDGYRTSFLQQNWDNESDSWRNTHKQNYTVNSEGQRILTIAYNWDSTNASWLAAYRIEMEYDISGNQTNYFEQLYDSEADTFINHRLRESQFNENGNQIHFSSYNWDLEFEIWKGQMRTDSDFVNGKRVNQYNLLWDEDNQDWMNNRWVEFIFDDVYAEKSTEIQRNEYNWDSESSGWNPSYEDIYLYITDIDPEKVLASWTFAFYKPEQVIEEEIRYGFGSTNSYHRIYSYTDMASSTVLGNINEHKYMVFPNPAKDHLTIAGLQSPGHIMIYDIQGKLLLNQKVTGNEIVDISVLSPGLYLYRIVEKQTQIKTGKLIKY